MLETALTLHGTGLITSGEVTVHIERRPPGEGICFDVDNVVIPACPQYIVDADRGVTLGADGKTLSIVEHFLSACAMTNHRDLRVRVLGVPELPLLDGSALPWVEALNQHFGVKTSESVSVRTLTEPVQHTDPRYPGVQLMAFPSDKLEITYLVDFPHVDMRQHWYRFDGANDSLLEAVAPARTFGFVSELPMLQAKGLARGVSLENTLGLTDEGGYTTPLRLSDEPIRHKMLDLIGDLMLCGVPIQQLHARLVVMKAGHASHIAFGKCLAEKLPPEPSS